MVKLSGGTEYGLLRLVESVRGGEMAQAQGMASAVGHLGVSVQKGYLGAQHVLVVKPAGVDVVMSTAAAV